MTRGGSFDYRQVVEMRNRIRKARTNGTVDRFIEATIRELALRLLRKIKLLTPVDTGLLRNSWSIGTVTKTANGYTVEVSTDIEYAEWVEYGHRYGVDLAKWKGGVYMMTLSAKELQEQLPAILGRKQKELMERILGV